MIFINLHKRFLNHSNSEILRQIFNRRMSQHSSLLVNQEKVINLADSRASIEVNLHANSSEILQIQCLILIEIW